MRKTVTGLLTVILVGVFAAVVFASVDSSSSTPAGSTTEDRTTTTGDNTTTTEDRAKHREDRGARRENRREDRRAAHRGVREAGEDISGPCDEAEHANDPRCTGAAGQAEDRNKVNNRDDHGVDDNATDDHSGHGRGGDESAEDHSGSGRSGSDDGADDDSSGHGGGGSDD